MKIEQETFGYAVKVHTYFDDDLFRTYDALIFDWDRMDGFSTKTLKDKTYVGWIDAIISFPGGQGPMTRVIQRIEHKSRKISAHYWEF
jgi:hypothetical protein